MSLGKKIKEIYNYRHMLKTLIKQDIDGRYKGSIFGFLWSLLNPLLLLVVYSLVFQIIFKADIENYPIYLFICLMPWNMFSNTIFNGTMCVSNNSSIIKKVYFPREVLPISVVVSNVIQYCYSFVIVLLAILISGVGLSWYILLVPLIVIIQAIFSLGVIMILGAINVYIRDVQYIMTPVMMIWMYATPILYSINMVPEKYLSLYMLNPMANLIKAYQDILYNHTLPNFQSLGIITLVSVVVLIIGYRVFNKLQRRFAEEV